jgi:hypothetical protein
MIVRLSLHAAVLAAFFCLTLSTVHAYDSSDTYAAIDQASTEHGVSWTWLHRVINCETGGTMNPYKVGDHGTSFGAAQLHRGGLLGAFYAQGYSDPMNPYEALDFTAAQFAAGNSRAWTCR